MKYGILSDIHSNLEAFEAVLSHLQKQGIEQYIFCGDLVGYGPDPEACVQKYRQLAARKQIVGVMGNHDAIFSHPEIREYFHPDALRVLDWSWKQLSKDAARTISFLPEIIQEKKFAVVHGSPRDPLKEYLLEREQFRTLYDRWEGDILFVGHTHVPLFMTGTSAFCRIAAAEEGTVIDIQRMFRYIINPGSVGKPRDNNPHACFGVWDDEKNTFHFLRVPYDFTQTQDKMRKAKLPALLIKGLSWGL